MKKNLPRKNLLTGLLGILLILGLVLTGCGGGAGPDPGGEEKGPGDLPALPGGSPGVSTTAEADALLSALEEGNGYSNNKTFYNTVIQIIKNNEGTGADGSSNFTEEEDDIKVSSTYSTSSDGVAKTLSDMQDIEDEESLEKVINALKHLEVGDRGSATGKGNTEAAATADVTDGELKILKGSFIKETFAETQTITITGVPSATDWEAMDGTPLAKLKMKMSGSGSSTYDYGWTVVSGGKAAKLVLKAKITQTLAETEITVGDDDLKVEPESTYSGSLKVYGADDKEVKTIDIGTETEMDTVLGYFGNHQK